MPIEVAEFGMMRSPLNPEQSLKVKLSILVIEFGIVRVPENPEQPEKAELPMLVT